MVQSNAEGNWEHSMSLLPPARRAPAQTATGVREGEHSAWRDCSVPELARADHLLIVCRSLRPLTPPTQHRLGSRSLLRQGPCLTRELHHQQAALQGRLQLSS